MASDKRAILGAKHGGGAAWGAAVVLVALFVASAWPPILRGASHGRGFQDQRDFHLPAVRLFARQWPRPDFSDYLSATTPGYHVVLAAVDRWVSDDVRVLQAVGSLFTLGFLATLGAAAGRRVGVTVAVVCCLPVIASLYVFSAGVWLLPDNAAWWGVLACLLIALRRPVGATTYLAGGAVLLALVLVRQSGLWAAAPLCAAAWLGASDSPFTPGSGEGAPSSRIARLAAMGVAVLPSIVVLLMFFRLWHGTVPPRFQHATFNSPPVSGVNPATPAAVLAEVGVVGFFFAGMLLPRLRERMRGNPSAWRWPALGAVLGLLSGILPKTSWDDRIGAGRYSGLWTVAHHLPTVHDRSPFIILAAGLGGALLAGWLVALDRRERWIFGTAWAGFFVVQCAGALPWMRYYEGFVLMSMVLMASRMKFPRAALIGPVVLALAWAGVTVLSIR